tara:strand:- start:8598 stop:8969 length:372 start_codon:yes stop_codon:yes gene_type:complete
MSDKLQILYVDDEAINLFLFKNLLANHFDVITVDSAKGGMEVLKENSNIKLVVSDLKMPEISGLDFIREARKLHSNLEYMVLTGYGLNDEIDGAIKEGLISNYIQKPYELEVILEIIKDAIVR